MKTTNIDGDLALGRNLNIGGNTSILGTATVAQNLRVKGWLDAPNIKGAGKGLFTTADKLRLAYPLPHDGWWAMVGDSLPAAVYIADHGAWVDTGTTSGMPTIDFVQYSETMEQMQADVQYIEGRANAVVAQMADADQHIDSIGHDVEQLTQRVGQIDGRINQVQENIDASHQAINSSIEELRHQQAEVDLSNVFGSKQELYDISERSHENYETYGFIPKLADQMQARHITKVWFPFDQAVPGAVIFACTYDESTEKTLTCTVTQIQALQYNEQGGHYDTDITLQAGEIYGFAFSGNKCQWPTYYSNSSDHYAAYRMITTAAAANAIRIGDPIGNASVRYRQFWHAVGNPSIVEPVQMQIDRIETQNTQLAAELSNAVETVSTFDTAFHGESYESSPLSECDKDYPSFGFVPKPEDQLPMRRITRVWLATAEMTGCSIISLTAEIDTAGETYRANTCRCIKKRPLTWNAQGWYDCDITIEEGQYYGFVTPVASHREPYKDDGVNFGSAVISTMAKANGVTEGAIFDKTNLRNAKFYHRVGQPSRFESLQEQIDSLAKTYRDTLYPSFAVQTLQSIRPHDMTWVGDQLWIFDKGSNGGEVSIYSQDLSLVSSTMRCFFSQSHLPSQYSDTQRYLEMKSVDYANGQLLVGNGSALFDGEDTAQYSRAYVFYQPTMWPSLGANVTFANCGDYKEIDFSALGHKCYALWAGSQDNDTMMVIVNFLQDIYQVRLGLGTDRLGQGTYAAASTGRHNGSWAILRHWHQDRTGSLSFHGGQFYRGHLYLAPNSTDTCHALRAVLGDDGSLSFDKISLERYGAMRQNYTNSGQTPLQHCYIDGMAIRDGNLYAHPLHNATGNLIIAII